MDAFEWISLFFYLLWWWIPIVIGLYTTYITQNYNKNIYSDHDDNKDDKNTSLGEIYKSFKTFLPKLIPSWAFGPIWTILYTFIAIAGWLYLNWSETENHVNYAIYYDVVNGFFLANWVLNILWFPLFFGYQLYWVATIDALLIFLTAVIIEVLMWIHSGLSAYIIVGSVIYIAYVIYSGYAFILSLDISIHISLAKRKESNGNVIKRNQQSSNVGRNIEEGDMEFSLSGDDYDDDDDYDGEGIYEDDIEKRMQEPRKSIDGRYHIRRKKKQGTVMPHDYIPMRKKKSNNNNKNKKKRTQLDSTTPFDEGF
jgi:tryptophan-rich sensory protein